MRYVLEIKKIVGLIKFTEKQEKVSFIFCFKKSYTSFLNFLISWGAIYYFCVLNGGEFMRIFVKKKLKNKKKIKYKSFKYQVYKYRYIKKKIYKLPYIRAVFSTNVGLVSNFDLQKLGCIGGQHLVSI